VRESGPILRTFQSYPWSWRAGPWDVNADRIWLWNATTGSAVWSAFADDDRITFSPQEGDLPLLTEEPPQDAPPSEAAALVVGIEEGASHPWVDARVQLRVDGEDRGFTGVGVGFRLYDPRFATLADLTDVKDVVIHPDGRAIVSGSFGLARVDIETGMVTDLPTLIDFGFIAELALGPDESLYVLLDDELWRLPVDGSEELVFRVADPMTTSFEMSDVAVTAGGMIYVAVPSGPQGGLWMIGLDGVPIFAGRPDCCPGIHRMAYDSITGRIYAMGGDYESEHLVAYDPETESFVPFGPGRTPDRVLSLSVDEFGRVYVSGRFDRPDLDKEDLANVIARFDPAADQWDEDVFAPTLWAIAVGESRLVGVEYHRLVSLPLGGGSP
jgi:hypothetical protein